MDIISGEEKGVLLLWLDNLDAFDRLACYSYLADPDVSSLYTACIIYRDFDQNEMEEKLSELVERVNKDIIDHRNQLKD